MENWLKKKEKEKPWHKDKNRKKHFEFPKRHVGEFPCKYGGKCSGQMRLELKFSATNENAMLATNPSHLLIPRTTTAVRYYHR